MRIRAIGMGNLRAFLSVAQHLNFRAAADELALTQSAGSRQIQALESEVGIPLFLRHTRAVGLDQTALALILGENARRLFGREHIDQAVKRSL